MDFEDFIESGKIASKVREKSKSLVKVGESALSIVENIEELILSYGALPAFPVNISINSIAAHYTPSLSSQLTIRENDVVKIDIGVSLNGAITDTAYTVDFSNKHTALIQACEKSLEEAIKLMKPGTIIDSISEVIESTIKSYGFLPVSNLTGHLIKRNILHAGVELPNVVRKIQYKLKEGDIFAVEPFASTGSGYVVDCDEVEIFSFLQKKPLRSLAAREIQDYIIKNYGYLPFAQRWLEKKFPPLAVNAALREMILNKSIVNYPVLKDSGKGIVAQAEHTILILDQPIILTR